MRRTSFAITVVAAAGALGLLAQTAVAQTQTSQLAASGDWVAHQQSGAVSAPPKVCLASTAPGRQMLGLRAASGDVLGSHVPNIALAVAYLDQDWSLPASVDGPLVLGVGYYRLELEVMQNTSDMVVAPITERELLSLIGAMHNATSMTVAAGTAAPETISLNGSNVATRAFLDCAGITPPGHGGASNPFG